MAPPPRGMNQGVWTTNRYITIVVTIPIIVASSWVLYKRVVLGEDPQKNRGGMERLPPVTTAQKDGGAPAAK